MNPFLKAIFGLGVAALSAFAQGDQQIYTDSLVNGWQSWSWANVDFANPSPVHSGNKSAKVSAAAWQAIYLHHDAFDSSGFTDLVFWIHGGSAGGQRLQVQATLNGAVQAAVSLNALPANSWQKISLSLAALGVANKANLDGIWIQDRSGTPQPNFFVDDLSLTAVPPPSVVNISVDASQTLRTIDPRHFALNAAVWDSVFDTPTTISLLTEMGNQALRFPGGSLSDEYHWQSNTSGGNTWQWATSFDHFEHVASATAAQVFLTVNYGSGTAAEAAAWVHYANVVKGLHVKYWEIGNENYGDWETDNNVRPHDPYTYATRFKDYYTQMKAADPGIQIGAVAETGEDTYANYSDHPATNLRTGQKHNGWTPVMLATLKALGVTPDFLIYHRYAQGPGNENDAGLLQSSGTWGNDAADLRQQLNDYLGSAASPVELVSTENNSVYSNPGKETTSLVNGLFLADSLGNLLKTEFKGNFWWDLRNGQETGNNNAASLYGWRSYGDYGIVSAANPAGPADRYPAFYVAKLLQHFARGGDQVVNATSDYKLLAAFASRQVDGSLSLLVINKSPGTAFTANISANGYAPAGTITAYSYGIAQDEAARIGTGSADIATNSYNGAAASFAFNFPPYSVTVLRVDEGAVPPPVVTRQPDVLVKASADGAYVGNNVYNLDGTNQTRLQTIHAGRSITYDILVRNDGSAPDSFVVRGGSGSAALAVKYYSGLMGSTEITTEVTAGTYSLQNLPVGASRAFRAVVNAGRDVPLNTRLDLLVSVASNGDAARADVVKTITTVK